MKLISLTVSLLFAMFHPKHKFHDDELEWLLIQDIVSLFHSFYLPNPFQMEYFRWSELRALHRIANSGLIYDHRHPKKYNKSELKCFPRLAFCFSIDFDHFQISASKLFPGPKERCHHCIRWMSMNDSTSTTLTIWQHKQWCTLTFLQSSSYIKKIKNVILFTIICYMVINLDYFEITFYILVEFECHHLPCFEWKDLLA